MQEAQVRGVQCRVVDNTYSFNIIADPGNHSAVQISLEKMRKVKVIDGKKMNVTVEAGTTYGELCPFIHVKGLAIHNLASLPHISIAGAVSTGTHGSSIQNKNLVAAVVGIDIVDKNGTLQHIERGDYQFCGAICSLGCLGVIVAVTLQLVPAFEICQALFSRGEGNRKFN